MLTQAQPFQTSFFQDQKPVRPGETEDLAISYPDQEERLAGQEDVHPGQKEAPAGGGRLPLPEQDVPRAAGDP